MLLAATQPVPQAAAQLVQQVAARPVPQQQATDTAATARGNDQQNAIGIDASDWQHTHQEWAAISGEIARNGY